MQDLEDFVGNTPLVRLKHLAEGQNNTILVKLEGNNPAGSVKDRPALNMITAAEARGEIKPGDTLIEATSGNTGIALAMVCAAKGYTFVSVMAESFSIERRRIMKAMGARVILTPAALRGTGMVKKAEELAAKHGWFLASQFENPANPGFHRNTTGPELLRDVAGQRLDYWVSGWGTGGTMTGVGEMPRLARPDMTTIATEPEGAAVLSGKEWAPHKIQGWTPDFIPKVLNKDVFDEVVLGTDEEARDTSLALASKEGILCGLSSGATLAAALKVAARAEAGSAILAMLPDTGERYLSTFLFEEITEASDDEWLASLG